MDLGKEEGRVFGIGLFVMFAASSNEALPTAVWVQRVVPLAIPIVFLAQGVAFRDPDAPAIVRRVSLSACGMIVAASVFAWFPSARVHTCLGVASSAVSVFFICRGGLRQIAKNSESIQLGESMLGQRPRVSTNLIKDLAETGFGVLLFVTGRLDGVGLGVLLGVPLLAASFNAVCFVQVAFGAPRLASLRWLR